MIDDEFNPSSSEYRALTKKLKSITHSQFAEIVLIGQRKIITKTIRKIREFEVTHPSIAQYISGTLGGNFIPVTRPEAMTLMIFKNTKKTLIVFFSNFVCEIKYKTLTKKMEITHTIK